MYYSKLFYFTTLTLYYIKQDDKTREYLSWVLVMGVSPIGAEPEGSAPSRQSAHAAIEAMQAYGVVTDYIIGQGNWIFIRYSNEQSYHFIDYHVLLHFNEK